MRIHRYLESYLISMGGGYQDSLFCFKSVQAFLFSSMISSFLGFLVGLDFHWSIGGISAVLGGYVPTCLLHISNKRDNEKIVRDLRWLYETVSVQLQAGLHMYQALFECDSMMRNPRFRVALREMARDLLKGGEVEDALDTFESKFHNHYISSFCIILRQAKDSGYAVKLLDDIKLQLDEMERMNLIKRKENMEMQLQFFQMLLFIGYMVFILYACVLTILEQSIF